MARTLILSASLAATVACATAAGVGPEVPTLSVNSAGYRVTRYKGRTVRVCGRLAQVEGRWAVQHIQRPREFFLHGLPAVFVATCDQTPPRLDRHGCLVGRIAREDGSLDEPRSVLTDDSPFTHYWLLHPQCPAAR